MSCGMLGAAQNSTVTSAADYRLPGGQRTCAVPWEAWERTDDAYERNWRRPYESYAWSCIIQPLGYGLAIWCQVDDAGEQTCAMITLSSKESANCHRIGEGKLRCRVDDDDIDDIDYVAGDWKLVSDEPDDGEPDYREEIIEEVIDPCLAAGAEAEGLPEGISLEKVLVLARPKMVRDSEDDIQRIVDAVTGEDWDVRQVYYEVAANACIAGVQQ